MRIANLLKHRQKAVSDVEEELRFHLEMLERKFAQQGMSTAEAKTAASIRFGDLEKIKQQCVDISSRNSLARRVFKTLLILLALTGLAVHVLSADLNVAHIGDTLIMIAISGRLLLYVQGLKPSTFLARAKETSASTTREPECS